jgi:hypothetical protein
MKNQITHPTKNDKIRNGMVHLEDQRKNNLSEHRMDTILWYPFLQRNHIMYIFVKTPLYKRSKYVPHIVEHCILSNNKKYSEYINNNYDAWWVTFCWYTKFYIPWKNRYKTLKEFLNPIDIKKINLESEIIDDEVEYENNSQWLFEKIWKKIYWKSFRNNWKSKTTQKEIIDYHRKYYKEENIVVCDDKYNILSQSIKIEKIKKTKVINTLQSFNLKHNKTEFKVFYIEYKSFKDFYKFKFIEIYINTILNYHFSSIDPKYYFECELFDILWEYLILAIPQSIPFNISQEDFKCYKKYFIKNLNKADYKLRSIISFLLVWKKTDNKEISQFINNISIFDIKHFLD